ncbi:hypothetical protein L9F63_007755 [Diploptera punctata]|uniref:Nucleoporin NUP42 n=1 Tax=Diploptera punctata TaxID=6984 RepID=A0AAD7Z702_DIPPU|nr:hypothetical protein L9F63_007755 [Diploptera punctata]
MVICKFFQQGNCRYGNNCRFDHIPDYSPSGDPGFRGRFTGHYPSNNYYSSHNKHNAGPYKLANSSHDSEELMKAIAQEVIQSEKGGQWPLSCYAPIKERHCYPGLEDHSPEEIRWKMYEALKNGTLPEYQRQIKELYEIAKMRRNSFLNPSEEMYKIIDKIFHGQKLETETNFSFIQAANQTSTNKYSLWNSPGFGSNQQTSAAPVSSNFSFSLPQFGGPVNQPVVEQSPNVFGASIQPMLTMHNIPVSNQILQSVPNQMPSVPNQMPGMFGNQSHVQNSSPFSNATQGFQQPNQPQVSAPNTGPMFGANNNISNINSTAPNKFESGSIDSSIYSMKTDLAEHEINAFLAQTFAMGKIPTKPPSRDLCTV